MDNGEVVRAAGGVVWRPGAAGVEVVIVRRPRYGDWSLPKGKLDPAEDWRQAAVREVAEETGLAVEVGGYLGEVGYPERDTGRPKAVRYWAMRAVAGGNTPDAEFTPNAEVDEIRWVPVTEAADVLTYDTDRAVVRTFQGGHRPHWYEMNTGDGVTATVWSGVNVGRSSS